MPCVRPRNRAGCGSAGRSGTDAGGMPAARRAASRPTAVPWATSPSRSPSPTTPPVARTPAGRSAHAGRNLAAAASYAGRSPAMVSRDIGCRPAGRGHHEVAAEPSAVTQVHAPHPAPATDPDHVCSASGVRDVHHLDADPFEVRDRRVSRGVRGQHHRPLAGPDGVQVDQPAHGCRQQHAGHVVAGEDIGAFDQPGRRDEDPGAALDQPLDDVGQPALHHRDPVVVVAAEHDGVGQHLQTRRRRDRLPELPHGGQVGLVAPAQVAAQRVLLLHEHHHGSGPRRRDRRRHPRRPTSRHQHVGVGVPLVEAALGTVRCRRFAAVGEPLEHPFVRRPQPARAHEGLVVEARGKRPTGHLVDRLHVEGQGRPGVLGPHVHARPDESMGAAHVGLVVHLHQAARVQVVGGEQAPRPVVLEAAGEDVDPARRERRGDRVARVGGVGAAVPGEVERRGAVDHLAWLRPEPVRARAHGDFRISLVTVSRSTTKYRRQPIRWYHRSRVQPARLCRR